MTTKTNPLAVLEIAERSIFGAGSTEFRPAFQEARAAVAELLITANEALAMLDTFNVEHGMYPEQVAHLSNLRAALAAFEVTP